jgi:hypothetical protein
MTVARLPSAARNCSHAAHGPALSPTPAAAKRSASVRPPPATPSECWSSAAHPLYEPGLTSLDNLGVRFSALAAPPTRPQVQYPAEELKTKISRTPAVDAVITARTEQGRNDDEATSH